MQIIEDDIFPHVHEHDVSLVGTNLYNTMSNGLQLDISLNYPYVYDANMNTRYGDISKLGTILNCKAENEPTFCLCYIVKGYNFRPDIQNDYLEYEALENCLKLANVMYAGMNVASPILGLSRFEGNGNRERILEIFEKLTPKLNLTLYDFYDLSRKEKMKIMHDKELEIKEKDISAYYQTVKQRKKEAEERFQRNKRRRY